MSSNTPKPYSAVAQELRTTEDELRETIARLRPVIHAARSQRVPPGLDDKIITAWNGMMISAMAEAGRVFGEERYTEAARKAADFILTTVSRSDGGLFRTYRAGKAHLDAYLEDYAYLAEGLIDLYEAGADARYLKDAVRLAERMVTDFSDDAQGGFFTTARTHETLLIRSREGPDGATPSGNAVAASVLARLASHMDRRGWLDLSAAAIRAYGRQIARHPRAFAKSLAGVDFLINGPVELAFVGRADDPGLHRLKAEVGRHYLPNRICASRDPADGETDHPLLKGKDLVNGKAALYVCRNFACLRPVTDPAQIEAALRLPVSGHQAEQTRSPNKVLVGQRLEGAASIGATAGYAVRKINAASSPGLANGFTSLGNTGLTVSRFGFGTYRVDTRDPSHRAALLKALRESCNLIDTSSNYMDGDSERLIGSALAELIKQGDLAREEVVIVSKIGYVQGDNLKQAEAREKANHPYPEMVKYGEGIWHCIHPEFLADQLAHSLDRLGLQTLDVCLLHNPEYYLSSLKLTGRAGLPARREEFYHRLQAAFEYLESQVAAGRLQYYGVSSNTAIVDAHDPEATSVSRMVESARLAAGKIGTPVHHFAVVQCPMNLYESGAALTSNTGSDARETTLAFAQREGLAVLVNRPLNAMPGRGAGMIRLAKVHVASQAVDFDQQRARVAELEQEYRRDIAPAVEPGGQGMLPAEFFNWAEELTKLRPQVQGLEHWEQIEHQMIAPHVNQVLQALSQVFRGEIVERWESWRDAYVPELLALLKEMQREAAERSRTKVALVEQRLDPLLPEARRGESLSRKAMWVLASTPGVTCVLNGMRSISYVDDSLHVMQWEPLRDPLAVYRAFAS